MTGACVMGAPNRTAGARSCPLASVNIMPLAPSHRASSQRLDHPMARSISGRLIHEPCNGFIDPVEAERSEEVVKIAKWRRPNRNSLPILP